MGYNGVTENKNRKHETGKGMEMNNFKSVDEIKDEMALYGSVSIEREEIKFEKAYYTMICNPNFNNNEVRLWLYLKLNDNKANYGAFPSNKKIQEETGMSVPTINKTLASLEVKNAIITLKRFKRDERRQLQNLVMFNRFNEYTGTFEDNEAWNYIKCEYKTRMVWIDIKSTDLGKTTYMPTPIQEHEIKEGKNGYTIL